MHATQYTIRGIPPEVDRQLRERAKSRKISINRLIVEELTKATIGPRKHAEFTDLVGKWEQDEAFDSVLEGLRRVDAEDWQ